MGMNCLDFVLFPLSLLTQKSDGYPDTVIEDQYRLSIASIT